MTKPSLVFDGDIYQLKKFVDYIKDNKYKYFASPVNNVLMTINTYEDTLINYGFKRSTKIRDFF